MFSSDVIEYLKDSLGSVEELKMDQSLKLPVFMTKEYQLKAIKLMDANFVLVEIVAEIDLSIDGLVKRRKALSTNLGLDYSIIFVFRGLSDYLRKRLIEERIAFIIPGKQIFILELGTIYTERIISKYSNTSNTKPQKLSPSGQGLLLHLLTSKYANESMKGIADKLNLSLMSISRGFKELMQFGLVKYDDELNGYILSESRENTWNKAKPFMSSPIQKKVNVDTNSITNEIWSMLVLSGESALAEYSMLAGPRQRTMGIGRSQYKKIINQLKIVPVKDVNTIELQIFRHILHSENGVLSELSIALALIDEVDERVTKEISIMLNDYFERTKKWPVKE